MENSEYAYTQRSIEEVATRLQGAKVFTSLDGRNGFWHVKLEEESTYLTNFYTRCLEDTDGNVCHSGSRPRPKFFKGKCTNL